MRKEPISIRTSYPNRSHLESDVRRGSSALRFSYSNQRYRSWVERWKDHEPNWSEEFRDLRLGFLKSPRDNDHLPKLFALLSLKIRAVHDVDVSAATCLMARDMLQGYGVVATELLPRRISLLLATAGACLTSETVHLVISSPVEQQFLEGWLGAVMEPLGITLGCVTSKDAIGMRRQKYRRDVVLLSARELALDFLRDQVYWPERQGGLAGRIDRVYGSAAKSKHIVVPGLRWAFLDRLDHTLIDEARIPVIIGPEVNRYPDPDTLQAVYGEITEFFRGADYDMDEETETPVVYASTVERIAEQFPALLDHQHGGREIEQLLVNGIRAQKLLIEGDHYQRFNDRLVIPGLIPGQGNMTSRDLDQVRRFLECREAGAQIVGEDIVARSSYSQFFSLYHHIAGTAVTTTGIEQDLKKLYHMHIRRPGQRIPVRSFAAHVYPDFDELIRVLSDGITGPASVDDSWLIIAQTPASQDQVLETFKSKAKISVSDELLVPDQASDGGGQVAVMTLRELLPLCSDRQRWGRYSRVNTLLLGLPQSHRQLHELSLPLSMGRLPGSGKILMVVEPRHKGDDMQVPSGIRWLGPMLCSVLLRPLVRVMVNSELIKRAKTESQLRLQWRQQQSNLDNLLAFSGKRAL